MPSVHLAAGDFDDFLGEMWLGVHEEAFLFELPGGSILHTADGPQRHGPWPPNECSRCLLVWFDRGWLNAYVPPEQLFRWSPDEDALMPDTEDETWRILTPARAREIIADPTSWMNDSAEGMIILAPASQAPDSTFRQLWLDAVRPS